MLSPLFLSFNDKDMAVAYGQEKRIFYAKIMPVITITMLILSLLLEMLQR
jgi:hypothetical protein